jgi:hypothetical protein
MDKDKDTDTDTDKDKDTDKDTDKETLQTINLVVKDRKDTTFNNIVRKYIALAWKYSWIMME